MTPLNICPHCNADLTGAPIPEGSRKAYGGATHFTRKILCVDPDRDITSHYQCPDCNKTWPREGFTSATKETEPVEVTVADLEKAAIIRIKSHVEGVQSVFDRQYKEAEDAYKREAVSLVMTESNENLMPLAALIAATLQIQFKKGEENEVRLIYPDSTRNLVMFFFTAGPLKRSGEGALIGKLRIGSSSYLPHENQKELEAFEEHLIDRHRTAEEYRSDNKPFMEKYASVS